MGKMENKPTKIEQLTMKVNQLNLDLNSWSNGVNDKGGTYLEKNRTIIITLGVMLLICSASYILAWDLLFNISGIILVLVFISNISSGIKHLIGKVKR